MSLTLNPQEIAQLTERVHQAQTGARPMPRLTEDFPAMTLTDGYAVQNALRHRWLAEGRRQVGWKAGLTSKAKMQQMAMQMEMQVRQEVQQARNEALQANEQSKVEMSDKYRELESRNQKLESEVLKKRSQIDEIIFERDPKTNRISKAKAKIKEKRDR